MKRRTLNKFLSAIIAVAIVLTSAPLSGFVDLKFPEFNLLKFFDFGVKAEAENQVLSGSCGATSNDKVYWSLDTETGVLNITGTGDMTNFNYVSGSWGSYWYDSPWWGNRGAVKTVNISEGVTSVGNNAFYECKNISAVTFADSVNEIGLYAFYNCTSLKSVTIQGNVKINNQAFYGCTNLTSISLTDSVLDIGEKAFYNTGYYNDPSNWENDALYIGNCLISIRNTNAGCFFVKEGTKIIAQYAGYDCSYIKSVVIPDSVTIICDYAFSGASLTSIIIGKNVRKIGKGAFYFSNDSYYNQYPNDIYFNGDIEAWLKISFSDSLFWGDILYFDGVSQNDIVIPSTVTEIKDYTFSGFSNITSVEIPDAVKRIGAYAFGNTGLKTVTIPNSVTQIGAQAFNNCDSLTDVTIPDGVVDLGDFAFNDCDYLNNVVIGDGVKQLNDTIFSSCDRLQTVTIGSGVESIPSTVFNHTMLKAITVDESNAYYSSDEYGVLYNKNKTELIRYPVSNNANIYMVLNNVTKIHERAFENCDRLNDVIIPDSVSDIGDYAFCDCDYLNNVVIGDGVKKLNDTILSSCDRLQTVTIGSGVESISSTAFNHTTLEAITIDESNAYYSSDEYGVLYDKNKTELIKCPRNCKQSVYVVPYTVVKIGDSAFSDCDSLMDVTIPDSVVDLGDYAFYDCDYLNTVVIGNGVKNINDTHFYLCDNLYTAKIGRGVESISSAAFSQLSLNLIMVDELNDYYSSDEYGVLYNKNKTVLLSYPRGNSRKLYKIPDTVVTISENSFSYSQYLNAVEIPDCVVTVGNRAFYNAGSLSSVKIGEGVTDIGSDAFGSCGRLATLTFGSNVTSVGAYAFSNTSSMNIYYKGDNESWCNIVFDGYSANPMCCGGKLFIDDILLTELGIPETITEIKPNTFYNCDTISSVTIHDKVLNIGEYAFGSCSNLETVYYTGCESEWLMTSIKPNNESLTNADIHFFDKTKGDVEKTNVKFVQGEGKDMVIGSVDVSFKQSWFRDDSLDYNHNLARLCSQYAMIGYDEPTSYTDKPNLRNALFAIGMDNVEIVGEAGRNHVNYFIASRKITVDSKEYDLVFVGLIGSYHEQWYSNFDPGTGAIHKGFLSAKVFVYSALSNYIKKYGFSKDTTKILITGHSRGAAASNLLAADLIKGEVFAKKENIYTYAFATPNSTTLPKKKEEKFNRIYNIVNPEDFVTKCMPAAWDYGRYGQTFVLPSKTNEKSSAYKSYKSNMQFYFSDFTGGDVYEPYAGGESNTKDVVTSLTSKIKNVNDFYDKGLFLNGRKLDPYSFFGRSLCHFASKVATDADMADAYSVFIAAILTPWTSPVYFDIGIYFFANQKLEKRFEYAHMAETYCAYMMSMTEEQLTGTEEQRRKGFRLGYENTVNCPVDVTVIDKETGDVVGKIVNNVIDEEIAAKENSVVMSVNGDSKSFWLPYNGDYEVILTGNDNGTMDYTVSEINSDIGEVERVNFYDVEITNGESYTGEFTSEDFVVEEYTITTDDNGVVSPDENLKEDDLQLLEINVQVSGDGYATESMTVTKGDYVTLSAVPEETGEFLGWYRNGELVSTEATYSFVAKTNVCVVAEFSIVPEKISGTITAPEEKDVTINILKDAELVREIKVSDGVYSLKGIAAGAYVFEVTAENCVTRKYDVTIGEEKQELDISINLIGDINGDGKITILDYTSVLKHVKKTSILDGYEFACADVDSNGKITVLDYSKILKHVKKTDLLW